MREFRSKMKSSSATSGASYEKVVRGKLTFKGDSRPRPVAKTSSASTTGKKRPAEPISEQADVQIEIRNGTGRITSSGTSVHGHSTEFMKQLSVGKELFTF